MTGTGRHKIISFVPLPVFFFFFYQRHQRAQGELRETERSGDPWMRAFTPLFRGLLYRALAAPLGSAALKPVALAADRFASLPRSFSVSLAVPVPFAAPKENSEG